MRHVGDASALPVTWWKASGSAAQSDCVECGIVDAETVAVRDSKNPYGPALLLSRESLAALVAGVRADAFDG